MKVNKKICCFAFFFYFFVFKDFLERQISVLGYTDELVGLSAIPICFYELRKKDFKIKGFNKGYAKYIAILLIVGMMGSLFYNYQPLAAVFSDLLLIVKFWLVIYVGRFFSKKISIQENAKGIFFHVKLITWLYVILFLMDNFMGGIFESSVRYGLRSTQLFYRHPTYFASCCMLLIAILLSIRERVVGIEKYIGMLLILMCTTLRSKAVAAAIAIMLIYYFAYKRKKKIRLRTMLLFLPLGIAIGWEQIEYYFFSSIQIDSARYQLLVKAIDIANDHFPFGAGFATFASYVSGQFYSPLYSIYGISNVNGLRMGETSYISDSFWPMILGEFGWIGLVVFCFALYKLFANIQKLRGNSYAFYVSGLSILSYIMIASLAESAFVHPMVVPLGLWLGILFNSGGKQSK